MHEAGGVPMMGQVRHVIGRRTALVAGGVFLALPAGHGSAARTTATSRTNGKTQMPDAPNAAYIAYVGCRTTKARGARGTGINVYRLDRPAGAWTHVQLLSDIVNPSFLTLDRTDRFLYAVHGDGTEASAFAVEPDTGRLAFINRVETGGRNPVHLAIDPGNKFLVVANHSSSSVSVIAVDARTGGLGRVVDLVELTGAIGPDRVEQPYAKPHQVQFDPLGRFIIVPDKGLDRIFGFQLEPLTGKLRPTGQASVAARAGSGPRHVGFHPTGRFAFVLNELDSTITAYRYDQASGSMTPMQILPALPDTFTGNSRAAEIVVSAKGDFVYASNRGDDTVAVFAVDDATGRLSALQWVAAGGRTPRFMTLHPDGGFLHVASEDDDVITTFRIEEGRLARDGIAARTGSPVCVVFRPCP